MVPAAPPGHPRAQTWQSTSVFDCAARFGDTSLNDHLLQGPDLTSNLTGVLLRFRQEPVTLMADVEQMFHQKKHRMAVMLYIDGDLSKNPVDHQMLADLFGASSSPCCASLALKKQPRILGVTSTLRL